LIIFHPCGPISTARQSRSHGATARYSDRMRRFMRTLTRCQSLTFKRAGRPSLSGPGFVTGSGLLAISGTSAAARHCSRSVRRSVSPFFAWTKTGNRPSASALRISLSTIRTFASYASSSNVALSKGFDSAGASLEQASCHASAIGMYPLRIRVGHREHRATHRRKGEEASGAYRLVGWPPYPRGRDL